MDLANRIYKLRKAANLSQEQLAEHLDVSRQSVSKWEAGQSVPELDKIVLLSELFGVSADYLLKGENTKVEVPSSHQSNKDVFGFAMGLCLLALGLIAGFVAWHLWQNAVAPGIVLGLQVVGIAIFEGALAAKCEPSNRKSQRLRFYRIAIWLLALVPSLLLASLFFSLYPRPLTLPLSVGLPAVIYICLSTIGLLFLSTTQTK